LLTHRDKWQASYQSGQRARKEGGIRSYFEKVETHVMAGDRIGNLKIVIDTGNGVAELTTTSQLRKLAAHAIGINDVIDGEFPGRKNSRKSGCVVGWGGKRRYLLCSSSSGQGWNNRSSPSCERHH